MANERLKSYARKHNVPLWKVAKGFGVTDSYFSKLLREEFTEVDRAKAIEIIDKLSQEAQ